MDRIDWLLWLLVGLAGGLSALGAALAAEWALLLWFGLWTAVWVMLLIGERGEKTAVYIPQTYANYLLVVGCGLLAYAAWLEVAAGWLLAGMITTLAAWDLDAFQRRLRQPTRVEQSELLIQAHLRQLFVALLGGGLLSLVALLVQFQLRFGWGLLLVLLLILAFSQLFRLLGISRDLI